MVTYSIEVNRPAAAVFAFLEQFDRHAEWQPSLVSVHIDTPGPVRVGTRVVERRRTPVGVRDMTLEITEHDPPHLISFRGTDGPVRPIGVARVEQVTATTSHIIFSIELEGRGIGRLIAPFALRQTAEGIPSAPGRLQVGARRVSPTRSLFSLRFEARFATVPTDGSRRPGGLNGSASMSTLPRMSYVERDGIWHIVARTDDAEAVTVCNLRIIQQT